ncbi:MAG: bifunctional hydroxymethylpyrimidine kinase/phosphomethylpyrimidine kinase [Actinobacteria bacterium]|nr:MAG: bifunctional hydroxymethylpyrimidine kinase/phosphomethylpyrimidine kinase [Actinomycetota bacterium]
MPDFRPPCVLAIAGSDSGGGAGIQADLKAFARCGVHGMTAVTAVTAQNTVAVEAVAPVAPQHIVAQVRAVQADIGVDAVKIGMLGSAETTRAVAEALAQVPAQAPVVLDPVMVAETGGRLLEDDAVHALLTLLVPRADVLTPNLPEARALTGAEPEADAQTLARALHALGPRAVVVTGGHTRDGTDVFYDGERCVALSGTRHPGGATHGSGCTHSAALAAHLALGRAPLEAARAARAVAEAAIRDGLVGVGAGAGPVDALGIARHAAAGAADGRSPSAHLR